MQRIKQFVRKVGLSIFRAFGTTIVDAESGVRLGRAFLLPWRGRVMVIGLEIPVRPVFLPQTRLSYWKQELGFTTHPAPNFPRCGKDA